MAEQKLQMKVSGMHCAACSTRIEKVVGNLDGIDGCSVNLATEQATVPTTIFITARTMLAYKPRYVTDLI